MSKCGNCYYGVMTGPNKMFCSAQNCFCEEVFYCEDYEPIVKSITNADHIRMMSDDELDKFLIVAVSRKIKLIQYQNSAARGLTG